MFNPNSVLQTRKIDVYQRPYVAAAALPANTVGADDAWPVPYVKRGWTDGGVGFTTQQQFTAVNVDQVPDPLYQIGGARTLQIDATLAELDPGNIKLVAGMGTATTTPPTATVLGQDELVIDAGASSLEINTWGLNIAQPLNNLPFRVLIPRGQSTGNIAAKVTPTQKGVANLIVTALPDESFTPSRLMVVRQVTPLA